MQEKTEKSFINEYNIPTKQQEAILFELSKTKDRAGNEKRTKKHGTGNGALYAGQIYKVRIEDGKMSLLAKLLV